MDILFDNIEVLFAIMRIAGLILFGYGIVFIVQEARHYIKERRKEIQRINSEIATEIIELMHNLRSYLQANKFDGNYLLLLIPVNAQRKRYANNASVIEVSMFIYDDEMSNIEFWNELAEKFPNEPKLYNDSAISKRFHLISKSNESGELVAYTHNAFVWKHKRFIKALYPGIVATFPDIEFANDCNGARIFTKNFHY